MSPDRSAWSRIKQRKLFQWALAYLGGAWLTLEVVDLLAGQLAWPSFVFRAALMLLSVGFLGVLVGAWFHGEKGQQRVRGVELLLFAALVLVAAVSMDRVMKSQSPDPADSLIHDLAAPLPTDATREDVSSIAVLPLANTSGDPDKEYFGDGLAEELINALTRVAGLRVAARTSAFVFKGRPHDVVEIGRILRVDHVLEGAWSQDGQLVRVTVRLVDARNGFQVWGETYERELEGLFQVQDEIATSVVQAVGPRLALPAGSPLVTASTEEPQAYEFYLKGRYFWNRRTPQDLRRAIELFDSAVALDTAYAAAYAGLALTYTVLPSYGWRNEDAYPNASGAARRALALDPTSAEAHVAQAMVHRGEFSWLEAEQAFLRAIEFNPGEPSAHQWYGQLLHVLGRGAQGLEELRRAHQLDPLSLLISFHLGWELHLLRRYEEASIELRDAAELNPAHPLPAIGLGFVEAEMGRIEAALAEFQRALANSPERWDILVSGMAYGLAVAGRAAEARVLLEELHLRSETQPVSETFIAIAYVGLGDHEEALRWLREAVEDKDWALGLGGLSDPALDPLRSDPRFEEILETAGLRQRVAP
jgi:TolB-like protein/Tfp pilus assembly protein PilF